MSEQEQRSTEVDFTTEEGEEVEDDTLESPATRKYDPEPEREKVRAFVARTLTMSVVGVAAFALIALTFDWLEVAELERYDAIFTALITLTGTALGFYFGGRGR